MLLDLAFIPKSHKLATDQGDEEIQTKSNQEEESIFETKGSDIFCDYSFRVFTNIIELKDQLKDSTNNKDDSSAPSKWL